MITRKWDACKRSRHASHGKGADYPDGPSVTKADLNTFLTIMAVVNLSEVLHNEKSRSVEGFSFLPRSRSIIESNEGVSC